MGIEHDHRAEAEAAMTMAAAATCELERLKSLRVALAWGAGARSRVVRGPRGDRRSRETKPSITEVMAEGDHKLVVVIVGGWARYYFLLENAAEPVISTR